MRRPTLLVSTALLALGLAACGERRPTAAWRRHPAAGAEVIEGTGTFPATVEHQFGTTTIDEEPQRVVSVGLTEQDVLLQLGVDPGRGHRLVRRPARRHLALGPRPARRRRARGAHRRRRHRVREDRRARARPDHRHQRRA